MHQSEEASEGAQQKNSDENEEPYRNNDNLTETNESVNSLVSEEEVFSLYAASLLGNVVEEVRSILGKADLLSDRAREHRRRAARELRSVARLLQEAERVEALASNAYHQALLVSGSKPRNIPADQSARIYISGRQMERRESRRRELGRCDQLAQQQRDQIAGLLQEADSEA